MKILTTSTGEQTLRIIPRSYPEDIVIVLRDDSTNIELTYAIENPTWNVNNDDWQLADYDWSFSGFYEEDGYLVINNAYNLVEGRYYDLTIKDGDAVIYRDKIFCTDQTIDQDTNNYYSVNEGVYTTEDSYDNEYIVI